MKKVIIIGAGVAGMSCGIFLQKRGFNTAIYEKNAVAGGELTGWTRNGYTIDNCIHWLTGTLKGGKMYKNWVEVGALGENVEIYESPIFATASDGKKSASLYRDIEKTRKELIKLSPEDENEINKFIDAVKGCSNCDALPTKPMNLMSMGDIITLIKASAPLSKVMKIYKDEDIYDFSNRFKNNLIKDLFLGTMVPEYQVSSLIFSYATIVYGNGDVPMGGSLEMATRMKEKYESLGGKLYLNTPVSKIDINGKIANGITLENGEEVKADYVVPACDASFTFNKLLSKSYMPKALAKLYDDRKNYPVISAFQVAFAVDGVFEELRPTTLFEDTLKVGTTTANLISTKGYDFQKTFAPKGKSVIISNVMQTEEDFNYWQNLCDGKHEEYIKAKTETAENLKAKIEAFYPFLKDKLTILDVWTPATYKRYCNTFHGAYMAFVVTKGSKMSMVTNKVKGLNNVFIASQWLLAPGGLPTALTEGKFAAQHILKSEKMDINI